MLEKIGAQADFLKVGDFKSAIEPYTRTTMSESSRKQMESMLDDFYEKSISLVKELLEQSTYALSREEGEAVEFALDFSSSETGVLSHSNRLGFALA